VKRLLAGARAVLPVIAVAVAAGTVTTTTTTAAAAPAPPSGPHPRLFLSDGVRAAMMQAASDSGSAVSALITRCRNASVAAGASSGYQGDTWSFAVSACALAWQLTGDAAHADKGIKLWRALLEDVDTLGDRKACLPGTTDERTATASIRRDTGYAIRFVGPHTALAYDWMHDAPGVTEELRAQSRDCFRHWITFYTRDGYLHDQPGANYHAGYVAAKTLIAVAVAGEDQQTGTRFWNETVDNVFGRIVSNGLAGDNGGVPRGRKHGALVGGDWPEGWQYGPLSITEYAFSARALEEQGVALPAMDAWASDLTLRAIYGLLPDDEGQYVGGDTDDDTPFNAPSAAPFDATLLGPGSAEAASWAVFVRRRVFGAGGRTNIYHALADARGAMPVDPNGGAAGPLPLWFLARGTRNLYARSSWSADAFWAVLTSAPRQVDDHQHPDASNFVFVRGADALVVDPSPYGCRTSLTSNAITVDSANIPGDYKPSQADYSLAEMPLGRGTRSGVVAGRADFAQAFIFQEKQSDVPLGRRDWVFLPEGEIVTIDRVTTPSATAKAYLRFRTPGTLTAASDSPFVARATVGGSALAIHAVALRPATSVAPVLRTPTIEGDCGDTPFGACRIARLDVTEYSYEVPGPDVLAIHVLDGLGAGEAAADVAPIDTAPIDADPPVNAGVVVGASVYRSQRHTFVLEPATLPAPPALAYSTPGANPTRHVVFDAPRDGTGRTAVSASASGGRCLVTLTAGQGVTGAPAIFTLAPAADGCGVSEDADVPPGTVPPGSGGFDRPGGGGPTGPDGGPGSTGGGGGGGGCGCALGAGAGGAPVAAASAVGGLMTALALLARGRRRLRSRARGRRGTPAEFGGSIG
jgi:hypothetical protein